MEDRIQISILPGTEADASLIAALHFAVAERLTREYGRGHWSSSPTDRAVLRGIRSSRVLVACNGVSVVGTLRLATKKPWAIDPSYFTRVERPLYLHDLAVDPGMQRQGIGRQLLTAAAAAGKAWPADAIRLDAYDAAAGAGPFYTRNGFRKVGSVTYRGTPLVYFELLL